MTVTAERTAVRRIVVTLGACDAGRQALETTVRLAAILRAELEGIFIEDINLIRLAELPFLRELRPWSRAEEALNGQRMQRELRAMARHAELLLRQLASEMGVNWSFRVWRGLPAAESLLKTFEADVLSLGRVGSLGTGWARPPARPGAWQARPGGPSISVLFSGSEQAERALATARQLAQDLGARLTVLLPETETAATADLQMQAAALLQPPMPQARYVIIALPDAPALARAVTAAGDAVLITEAGHPVLQRGGLDRCLETLPCPLLLVR